MRFQSILVHADTRSNVRPILDRAIELARLHGAGLKIVEIVPELPKAMSSSGYDFEEMRQLLVEKKSAAVDALVADARSQGIRAAGKVLTGRTSAAIIDEVAAGPHDLVMKEARGIESHRSGYLGTTATRLMRSCPCTVWAFRPPPAGGPRQVAAAVDAWPADDEHARLNREILEVAFSLGAGTPHVVYVWTVYGERLIKDYLKRDEFEALVREAEQQAREKLAQQLAPWRLAIDSPHVHLLKGTEDEVIAQFINDGRFESLVIGTVGRSGISGVIIGNTAETLLDRVHCSVIAVKPASR
jgi:nucleotide-binding universal stress UspA family protein